MVGAAWPRWTAPHRGKMESRIQVFLSSMINERTKPFRGLVRRQLEDTKLARVWCFEKEPAFPILQDSYLDAIDRSDVFVLMLWDDLSDVVQREFERCRESNVPWLVFWIDTSPPSDKLSSFLNKISSQTKWKKCTEEDLPSSVEESVRTLLIEKFKVAYREQIIRPPLREPDPSRVSEGESTISDEAGLKLAARVVAGQILCAVVFFDEADKKHRIAVLAQTGDYWSPQRAVLLTEFAGGYRVEWESKALITLGAWANSAAWFGAQDVDGDGRCEVFFAEGSHGTGSGSEVFYVYVPSRAQVFSVTVEETRDPYFRTWIEPCRELLAPAAAPYLSALESRMDKFRVVPDIRTAEETPEVAWYRENGFLKNGRVELTRICGPPRYGASVNARHEDGNTEWYAFFKGPVIGYDRLADEHFVVYGPATMYHWPTCFASNQAFVWFGTRGDGVFQFSKKDNWLAQMPAGWLTEDTKDVSSLKLEGLSLIVNGSHRLEVPW